MNDLVVSVTSPASHPQAHVSAGMVRGRWEAEVAVFRGIPFASISAE